MIYGYVYCYRNIYTNEYYVGQTTRSISDRAGEQGKKYLKQPKFGAAIKEYGWDAFEYILLQSIKSDDLKELVDKLNYYEKLYIQKFNSYLNGYNCTTGGKNCIRPTTQQLLNKKEEKIEIKAESKWDKKVIGTYVTFELYEELKKEAVDNSISISDMIRKILYLYIKNKNNV